LVYGSLGENLTEKEKQALVNRAIELSKTFIPQQAQEVTTGTTTPKTARELGASLVNSPLYQTFNPENLGQGVVDVSSGIGNFFRGVTGL